MLLHQSKRHIYHYPSMKDISIIFTFIITPSINIIFNINNISNIINFTEISSAFSFANITSKPWKRSLKFALIDCLDIVFKYLSVLNVKVDPISVRYGIRMRYMVCKIYEFQPQILQYRSKNTNKDKNEWYRRSRQWWTKSVPLTAILVTTIFITMTMIIFNTAWKLPVLRIILVRIFPHSDWIRRDTPYLSVFSSNVGQKEQE